MKAATHSLSRLMRDLFRVEPLEPRVLLSADPISGAAQIVLRPADEDGAAALVAQAYAAQADVAVATAPGSTVVVANGAAQAGQSSEWLHVDTTQLGAGNGTLLVGGEDGNAVILVGDEDGGALHMGSLVLVNPQEGGEVFLRSELHLSGSLVIVGSGHTTQVIADTNTADNIFILDSVEIVGNRTLTAGNDGSGELQLGEDSTDSLNGDGVGGTDSLVLRTPDNVYITGPVGNSDPLEGLTIAGVTVSGVENRPQDVTFTRAVVVNGDLVITASGIVTFNDRVEITGGGDLRIIGAEQVIFRSGVVLTGVDGGGAAGDLFVEANEITFQGGDESVSGKGVLTLRPTDVTAGIELGTPPSSQPTGVLNISNDEIRSFAEGFSRIVIGHQAGAQAAATAGTVRIGAINALDQPTLRDPLEVYGGTIVVEDYSTSDYEFQVEGTIALVAHNNIVLRNQVEASVSGVLANISLYSHVGRVIQENATLDQATSEPLRADTLVVRAATGIDLGFTEVATLQASNVTSGSIAITETTAGADVVIASVSQVGAGSISVRTTAGNITVAGDVTQAGNGGTLLYAGTGGAVGGITVNQEIHSVGGSITLMAVGTITTNDGALTDGTIVADAAANVLLQSSGGAIAQGGLIQSGGGTITLNAATTLGMTDGVITRSLNATDTGGVSITAGGSVTLSIVEADAQVSINAGGSIVDGLTGDNPNIDGETAVVMLAAAGTIGAGAAPLQTRVLALAASSTGTAGTGIFVREATALVLAGTPTYAVEAGNNGAVSIVTTNGALTVSRGVRSIGTGNILLQSGETAGATDAALNIAANVVTSGSVSLLSADGIVIDDLGAGTPQVASGTGRSLDLQADDGIAMEGQALLYALDGNVRALALGGDLLVGRVSTGTVGMASLHASGSILQGAGSSGYNVSASAARLEAGGAIGAAGAAILTSAGTLAASAGGAVFLSESDHLVLGDVAAVSVGRVGTLGTITSNPADGGALAGIDAGGALVVTTAGTLTVSRDVTADGNLRLNAGSTLSLAASAGSTGGSVTAIAASSMSATAAGTLYSDAGTVELQATAITLADGSLVRTDAGNIRIHATTGALAVGRVDARSAGDRLGGTLLDTWGDVSLVAGTTIVDNTGETAIDVYARNLRLQAASGIAAAGQDLETELTGVLAATSGTGALFLSEASQLTVGAVADFDVNAVGANGAAVAGAVGASASGIASGGALALRTLDGALLLATGGVTAAGNLLLQAQGTGAGLTVSTAVTGDGHLSLVAAGDLLVAAGITGRTAGRTIDLQAGGALTQQQGTAISATDANIALKATGAVIVESVSAGTGGAWISGASISDGDAGVDITAASAQLFATGGIGASGAPLETSVGTLTASATGGLYLTESNGLAVGRLELNVERVNTSGGTDATTRAAQQGLSAGTTVLNVVLGNLTLTAGTGEVTATGALLLDAAGAIDAQAQVSAATHLSVVGASIAQSADGDFLAGGTIDVEARTGAIAMADGAVARNSGSNIRYAAGGAITVGQLDARSVGAQSTWGSVSIRSGAAISDNPETAIDVYANDLRLQAATGIAAGDQRLETEAVRLSAAGGTGGVYLAEASALAIATTSNVAVNRVGSDGSTLTPQSDAAQSGVGAGTQVVVTTTAGALVVSQAVTAAGNLRLAAGGTGDVDLTAAVTSNGGDLSLQAGGSLLLSANVYAGGAGKTIDLVAGTAITQAQDTLVSTLSGNVSLAAAGNVTLEKVLAGSTGTAIRISAGAIVDGDTNPGPGLDTEVDLVADTVQLITTGAIAAAGAPLETTTNTLAVDADGDVFLNNSGALLFGDTTVNVARVGTDGNTTATTHALLAGLAGDDVVVRALAGGITTNAGAAIAATGNLRLEAVGGSSTLTLNAATSAAGSITMVAGNEFQLRSSLATTANGSTIDVQAALINAAQGSSIVAANANVQLQSGNSVTLESVDAGTGNVRIAGSLLSDGDTGANETEVDIVAAGLQLAMTGAIGTGNNPLEVSVDRLTVSAGNNAINIVESTGLVLGSVDTFVKRVDIDGVATATTTVSQSNVSGSSVVVRTLAGSLESLASGAVTGTGNILLRAAGTGADLTLGAAVTTSNGNVSIEADRHLRQNASVTSTVIAGSKTLDLRAGGDLTQAQGVTTSTINGNVSLTAGGTLTLEGVSAGAGQVGLFGASIVDGDTDAPGSVEVDVLASAVRLQASGGAIGTSTNAIETTTSRLAVRATGDVFVDETDGVSLEGVSVAVTRVLANGGNATSEAVETAALAGDDVVVRALAGSLQVQANGALAATGNVLLQAAGGLSDLTLLGGVASSGGHVSLDAGHDLLLQANVATTAATGTIDLLAGRNLTQNQLMAITSAGGNVALQAAGTATIELVNAGAGAVRIAAATVTDGDGGLNETEVDVVADALLLQVSAATGIGTNALETTIAALAASGGGHLFLTETNALATRSVTVNVQRVVANGTSTATLNAAVAGLASGTTVVRTNAGALTIESGAVTATGNLLLQAGGTGTLTVQDAVSGAGHVTLKAGGDLQQSAGVSATTSGLGLHLEAGAGITQQQGVVASSNGGPLSLQAGGDVTLARLQAGGGTVRIVGANVVDVDAADASNTDSDIVAGALQMVTTGGVGTSTNALETTVTTLAAEAGCNLFAADSDALVIGATTVTVQRVGQDGIAVADAAATLNGLLGNAAAVVRATGGALSTSTTTGRVSVAGNLLLQSSAGAELHIGATVTGIDGHISLAAGQDLRLDANVTATGAGDTVDLLAARSIVQAQGTSVTTNGGNIALEAVTGTSTITSLVAGAGGVLVTGGALVDGDAPGSDGTDISGATLQILSSGGVGSAGAALETSVAVLAAAVDGDFFIDEANALVIDDAELTVRRVGVNGSDAATPGVLTSGLAGGGDLVLQTAAGSLSNTEAGTIEALGNLLLRARGTDSDLTLDGWVRGEGAITIDAARDLLQNAAVDAVTASQGLELLAGRDFVQAQDVAASVDGGVLRVLAGRNAILESLVAGTGVVSLQAVDVIDGDAPDDSESDIAAAGLALIVGGTVGTGTDALETTVARLAGFADLGLFLAETDALVLGTVAFEGQSVGTGGAAGSSGAYAFTGLNGSDVVIRTLGGNLSSEIGNDVAVTGNLLLASASGFDIALAGAISNDGGATTVASGGALTLDARIDATATGETIELVAALGIVQAEGTAVTTANGAIVLRATTDITLESLDAGTASVRIEGRSVLDGDAAGDGEVDIAAGGLLVVATGSIGAAGADLETAVARVTAKADDDIFLVEADDVEVGEVAVTVRSVGVDGEATAIALDAQSVLQGDDVVLRTLDDGALTVLAGGTVTARGNLLLAADGTLTLLASASAASALSLAAGEDLVLDASVATTGDGATIDILAGGAIDAREGSSITTADGDVQLDAAGTVTLESIDAGAGSVRIVAASIVDGDDGETDEDREVDIVAAGLQLATTGDVAALDNALETSVSTLSIDAGGSVAIAESDDLLLATVTTEVLRVDAEGAAATLGAQAQSDVGGTWVELQVLDGELETTATGVITASSHVVVSTSGDMVLGGSVTSNGGQVSLLAGADLLQNADVATTGAGDTLVVQAMGDLTQADGVSIRTNDGNAAVAALGRLTIEQVDLGTGNLLVFAGEVVDGDPEGDADVDVVASGLLVQVTAGSVGTGTNAIETQVDTLAADVAADLFLVESDAISLEAVTVALSVAVPGGVIQTVAPFVLSDVAGRHIVIRAVDGTLSTQSTGVVDASGNVLLAAFGLTSDVVIGGAVQSSAGHITLSADRDLRLGADVVADGDEASIALFAGRDLTQDEDTVIALGSGTIALDAGGTVTFESIAAGTGAVSIVAASIVDGDTDADETQVDIGAATLVLQSAGTMGVAGNAIETTVARLAVSGGGDLFLTETDALVVASLSVQAQRVTSDAEPMDALVRAASGLTTATTVVQALDGTLTVDSGAAVAAGGNLLLTASDDLVLRADVLSDADASLVAGGDLLHTALVGNTAVAGHSVLLAAGGSVTQEQGASAHALDGVLAVEADGEFTLASLQADAVRISAGAVIDGDADDDTDVDVEADALQMVVGGAIGAAGNAVETSVATLSADAGGALFLAETDDLQVGESNFTLARVDTLGASNDQPGFVLAGVQGGADAVVRALAGSLTVTSEVAVAGDLLLQAAGANSDLLVQADVASSGGNVSLAAGRDLDLQADVAATGSGFSIDLLAGGDLTQADGTAIGSANGAIALEAGGTATVESIAAGTAGVRIAAAAIVDGDATEDAQADITAASALLFATGAIGASGADLETGVASLSAQAGGDIFILEADALALDTVTVNVQRVDAEGGSAATAHAAQAGVDGGNTVVVRTVAGSLASTAAGAVSAAGNLLLQAGGTAANMALAGSTSAAGNLSLEATGSITLTSSLSTTDSGSTIDVVAGTSLTAAQGSLVATEGGNVLLRALDGNVTLERVAAGTGVVRITGANLVDGDAAGDTEEDIAAAQLLVTVTGSMGSAANAIETGIGLLSVDAGGEVVVSESDTLALGEATAAEVNRVGADGTIATVAAVTQSGITATGLVRLLAQGTVDMEPNTVVATQGDSDIVVTSIAGSILMDPTTGVLRTGSGDIRLTAEIDIRPGALITTGFAYLDARDGEVLIQGDLQRDGEDIDIFANDVTIEEAVSSPGGTLRIGPLELVPMIIGGPTPSGPALHLDVNELALLQDGFARIILGSNLAGQVIEFRGTAAPLVFRDPLVVNATGSGGTVLVTGQLRGDTVTFQNAGSATTFRDATLVLQRTLLLEDQLVVRGANTVLAAQAGSGSLRFMQTVTGYGGSADKLTLDANGGDIRFDKAVSALDGLAIRDADDVSFYGAVSVSGDLVIQASGTVTFKGPLTLTNGGRLIVTGGGKVVFGATANLGSGDHLLKVSALAALGGTGSIRGTGELEIRGAADSTAIHLGSGAPRGALAIGDTFLRAVGKGFDALRIGSGDAKVTIGATDLRSTASPVVVDGKTIALKGTGNGVRLGTDLTLHASGSITTSGKIVASKASDVVIDSDKGSVSMASGSSIRTLGGDVSLEAATGLKVADIDARAKKGRAGVVELESTKGSITDANRDKAVDIYAAGLTMKGLGPKLGAGDVLEVDTRVVRITPPSGSVLRESGTDGRSQFSVLQGRNLYQAMVVVGPVKRITSNVETYLSRMSDNELSFSSGQAIKRGSQVDYWSETMDL